MPVSKMEDFNPEKTDVPYCSIVNNFENYSVYPMYNTVITKDKTMFRMPCLNHFGFISYWRFFSKYLKPEIAPVDISSFSDQDNKYIQAVSYNYCAINALCNILLDNNINSASRLVDEHKTLLFEGENQLNLLARMFKDTDTETAVWLYLQSIEYQPDSWEAHCDLGIIYKEKGDIILAKNELLKARELNPENTRITDLLDEVKELE